MNIPAQVILDANLRPITQDDEIESGDLCSSSGLIAEGPRCIYKVLEDGIEIARKSVEKEFLTQLLLYRWCGVELWAAGRGDHISAKWNYGGLNGRKFGRAASCASQPHRKPRPNAPLRASTCPCAAVIHGPRPVKKLAIRTRRFPFPDPSVDRASSCERFCLTQATSP